MYSGIKIFYADDVDPKSCKVLSASNVYQDVGGACAWIKATGLDVLLTAILSPQYQASKWLSCSPTLLAAKFTRKEEQVLASS